MMYKLKQQVRQRFRIIVHNGCQIIVNINLEDRPGGISKPSDEVPVSNFKSNNNFHSVQ